MIKGEELHRYDIFIEWKGEPLNIKVEIKTNSFENKHHASG